MRRLGHPAVVVTTALVVLVGCTSGTDDDADDAATAATTDGASTAPDEGQGTDDASATDRADDGEGTEDASEGDTAGGDATDDDAPVAGPSVSEIPTDASDAEQALAIIEQLYSLEHAVREDLSARALDGDTIGEVPELIDRFAATRTLDAARAEAEELVSIGSEDLALFTEGGVREPTVTDVEVEASRSGCLVVTATTDVLTTFNDRGEVVLRYRLVAGEGNGTGWLIDRISSGEVPDC